MRLFGKFMFSSFLIATCFASQYEQDNNDMLLSVIGAINNQKTSDFQRSEKAYCENIKKDLEEIVTAMPRDLRGFLGDFGAKFDKFDKKLSLLRDYATNIKNSEELKDVSPASKDADENFVKWSMFGDEPMLTVLGLKPVTLLIQNERFTQTSFFDNDHKNYQPIQIINRSFENEITVNRLEAGPKGNNNELLWKNDGWYFICTDPIFSPGFVMQCYNEKISCLFEHKNNYSIEQATTIWQHAPFDGKSEDDRALMLGYAPTWGTNSKLEGGQLNKARLLDPRFSALFRTSLVPGNISCEDCSWYVRLYEKCMEYAWIKLFGFETYLRNMEQHIKQCATIPGNIPSNDANVIRVRNYKEQNLSLIKQIIQQAINFSAPVLKRSYQVRAWQTYMAAKNWLLSWRNNKYLSNKYIVSGAVGCLCGVTGILGIYYFQNNYLRN